MASLIARRRQIERGERVCRVDTLVKLAARWASRPRTARRDGLGTGGRASAGSRAAAMADSRKPCQQRQKQDHQPAIHRQPESTRRPDPRNGQQRGEGRFGALQRLPQSQPDRHDTLRTSVPCLGRAHWQQVVALKADVPRRPGADLHGFAVATGRCMDAEGARPKVTEFRPMQKPPSWTEVAWRGIVSLSSRAHPSRILAVSDRRSATGSGRASCRPQDRRRPTDRPCRRRSLPCPRRDEAAMKTP